MEFNGEWCRLDSGCLDNLTMVHNTRSYTQVQNTVDSTQGLVVVITELMVLGSVNLL